MNHAIIPELDILRNEIGNPRDKRKIAHIRFALDNYLSARQRLERDRALKKKAWYRFKAWLRYGLTAQ